MKVRYLNIDYENGTVTACFHSNEDLKRAVEFIFSDGKTPIPISIMDAHIKDLIDDGQFIDAIKYYRTCTGLGLKESKDYVDKFRT